MRLGVDKEADALYLRLDDSKIIESEEVAPGSFSRLAKLRHGKQDKRHCSPGNQKSHLTRRSSAR